MNIRVPTPENLRKENDHKAILAFQRTLQRMHVWHTCLNCDNWSGKQCNKYKAVPPPEVIVNSCVDWDGDIPF